MAILTAGTKVLGFVREMVLAAFYGAGEVTDAYNMAQNIPNILLAGIVSAVAGSLIYRIILQAAYKVDMPSYAVKLLSAAIVVAALSIPLVRRKIAERRADRAEEAEA